MTVSRTKIQGSTGLLQLCSSPGTSGCHHSHLLLHASLNTPQIETGALPCAILELAPDGTPTSASAGGRANCPGQQAGGGGPGRQGAAAGSPSTAAAGGRPGGNTAASAGSGGGAAAAAGAAGGGAAGLALQRIVPPELAAAVPCMTGGRGRGGCGLWPATAALACVGHRVLIMTANHRATALGYNHFARR